MRLCGSQALAAALLGLQILSQHKVSAEVVRWAMDVDKLSEENEQTERYRETLRILKAQYPNFRMEGTEVERLELLELKTDLEEWLIALENLDKWRHPYRTQALNVSLYRIQYWMHIAEGEEIGADVKATLIQTNRMLLETQPMSFGPPDEETLNDIIDMVEQLRTIWSMVTMKFVEAVVRTSKTLQERLTRTCGVVALTEFPEVDD